MTQFFVSPEGSDAADGSAASPWRTISHAVSQDVGPGDVIVVRPGTYVEQVWMWRGGGPEGQLTLRSEVPGEALIRPPAGAYSTLNLRADHITVEGFDIVGGEGHGIDAESVAHTEILDNVVHGSGGSGIQFNFSEFILIEGNVTFGNAGTNGWHTSGISVYQNRNITGDTDTPGFRTIIRDNISDDFQSTQTAGFPNYTFPTLVENNLAFNNGGKGIQVTWSDFVTVRGNTVAFNNTDDLNPGTWRGELSNAQSSNNLWEGNVAVTDPAINPNNSAIGNYSYGGYVNENVVWRDNVTFNGTSGDPSIHTDGGSAAPRAADGNLLGVDPRFADPAGFDFSLLAGSPAAGLGAEAWLAAFLAPPDALPDEPVEEPGDSPTEDAAAPPPLPDSAPPSGGDATPLADLPAVPPPAETPDAPVDVADDDGGNDFGWLLALAAMVPLLLAFAG